jgi:MFS family permease
MVNEWWIARRGLAFGIITGASGASGVAMPFIADALLKRYGYQTTLRSMAVGMALLTGPIIPLFKQRLPAAEQSAMSRTDWSFLKGSPFWIYGTSCLTQGLGFFFPTLYLPSYATSIGLSATEGALLVALLSIGQVTGQFTFGYLSDGRLPLNLLAVCSTVVAGVATVTLWGLANSLGPLVAFSLIYGFFAFGFVAIRPRMSMAVSENPSASLAIFSILVATQGVGNVVSGPISSGLLLSDVDPGGYGAARYKSVVIFTGSCMMLSALSTCSSYLWPRTAARRS